MARTKQEVRDFLNTLVGAMVNEKCGIYNGQCVSLIKALLEFLGAPDPYAARGNARDVGYTLLRQGLAENGTGWLNVCVNRDMGLIDGVRYGHIWLDLANEANFEQNGSKALHTTKNTRPISQAQQIVNLDQYIKEDSKMNLDQARYLTKRIGLLAHMSEAEVNNMEWVDYHAKNIVANVDYAAALAKQLYEVKVWQDFNWKGVVYNHEVTVRDQKIEELTKQLEAGGGDTLYEPIAEVDGKPTLFVKKAIKE